MAVAFAEKHWHYTANRVGSRVVRVKITVAKTTLSVTATVAYSGEEGLSGTVRPVRFLGGRDHLADGLAESRDECVGARK